MTNKRNGTRKVSSPSSPSISVPQQIGALTDEIAMLRGQVESFKEIISSLEGIPAELKSKITLAENATPQSSGFKDSSMTAMGLKMLANDNHRRKWCVIIYDIYGISGEAGEEVDDTLSAVQRFGQEKLGLHKSMFSAIHRLSRNKDAAIIARFSFLGDKDKWLRAASRLNKDNKIRSSLISRLHCACRGQLS